MPELQQYADVVSRFEVIFSKDFYPRLVEAVHKRLSLIIDFQEFEQLDHELADYFLENSELCFKAIEESIANTDVGGAIDYRMHVRFKNVPGRQLVRVRDLRSQHIGKFIAAEGIIKQASEVRPEITAATFECRACGERMTLLQEDQELKTPYMCECGNKRGFDLVVRKLVDLQRIELEESPETMEGSTQARKIGVFIKDDLVDPKFQKRIIPGTKIRVTGILYDYPMKLEKGKESKRREIYIDGNFIETIEQEFEDLEMTKEEEEQIRQLATDPKIYDTLVQSIAPSIFGYENIKEAIALQLFGGVRKKRPDGITTRGDVHILLIGDPGAAKSQLLKYVTNLAPKARYVVGKSASGAGITATVVKDEFMRGWALEAGALVLANKGLACIDELDKMGEEDRSAMHEIMEQQTVTVAKANVQATLHAQTTILAAANPKFGRFDPYSSIAEQIDMPDTLLSRFDLIFTIRDLPNKEKDAKLVRHILKLHENPEVQNPPINSHILRRYIAYAKTNCTPKLTQEAEDAISEFYVSLRNKYSGEERSAVPISPRQLEALIRMSEASAKIRLSPKIEKEDADRAIKLLMNCLHEVGVDPETGKFDIDRLESGTTATQRSRLVTLMKIITDMQEASEDKMVPFEDIIAAAEEQGIANAEEIINKLKKEGEVFEPKQGFLKKI